jgi:hypothetical protein
MNTARFCRLLSLRVSWPQYVSRIDPEEVDGANPFGPTFPWRLSGPRLALKIARRNIGGIPKLDLDY